MAKFIPFKRKKIRAVNAVYDDLFFMLDDFLQDGWMLERSLLDESFQIDVKETGCDYVIAAELPGVQKEEIALQLNQQILSISVALKPALNPEQKNCIPKKPSANSAKPMNCRIRLGKSIQDKFEAVLNNGVLTITIPKNNDAADK